MIIHDLFESPQLCPECGGPAFSDLLLAEKKDACYHKVKASAKVWPSAYASGRLVQCRKKGADNYGNSKTEDVAEDATLAEEFELIESIIHSLAEHNGVDAETIWEDLESLADDELYVFAVTTPLMEDWQKANKRDKTDGMSQKAVNAYRREHPGSKLKTAVTTKPSKLKRGSKASKRRKSYCSRSRGQMKMHSISCAKTPDKAICKARRRWNCESVDFNLSEMDKTQTSPGRDGDVDWTKKQIHLGPESTIKAKDIAKHGLKALDKAMKKSHADTPKKKGVAEGSDFGAYYHEQLAQKVFDIAPNLQDENEILKTGYAIAKKELGSRANGIFRNEDFPSDFVSAYGYLKKQGVAEGSHEDEGNPVMNAITIRIINTRPDLLQYDLTQLQAAIRDVALDVGDVDEIGSSDISGWVKQVEQQLSGAGVAEDSDSQDPVTAFLARGGQIQRGKLHKPRKGERWQGSSHIGAAGGRGTKGSVSGLGARTDPKGGKPVVSAEATDNEKIGGRYDPDEFDAMVSRLKHLAGAGPLKTVYDPQRRVYRNVPVAQQPDKK